MAQTVVVKGIVKDSLQNPLVYANVFAIPQKENSSISYAITNELGEYKLKIIKNHKYIVTTTFLGYYPKKAAFLFAKDTMYNFTLQEKANQLNAVELKYVVPIVIKKDTTTYNASSFTTGNERKLKDVLRKLPGVEVDRNGNVLVKGKKVHALLVEDKSFFGGNTKLGIEIYPQMLLIKYRY